MSTPLPDMGAAEAEALVAALQHSFGNCICQSHQAVAGHIVWIDTCAGHAFLQEPHRLARLLWIHRTRQFWINREHGLNALLAAQLGEIVEAS